MQWVASDGRGAEFTGLSDHIFSKRSSYNKGSMFLVCPSHFCFACPLVPSCISRRGRHEPHPSLPYPTLKYRVVKQWWLGGCAYNNRRSLFNLKRRNKGGGL